MSSNFWCKKQNKSRGAKIYRSLNGHLRQLYIIKEEATLNKRWVRWWTGFESRNWTYWQCSWCCCRSGDYAHTSVWHQRRCTVFLKWIIKWFCLESLNICNTSIRQILLQMNFIATISWRWQVVTLEPELSGHSSTALDYCSVQLNYKIYE